VWFSSGTPLREVVLLLLLCYGSVLPWKHAMKTAQVFALQAREHMSVGEAFRDEFRVRQSPP
jgi:hypothetical protein